MKKIAILANTAAAIAIEKLHTQLQLPIIQQSASDYDYLFAYQNNALVLQKTRSNFSPLKIDFLSATLQHRIKQLSIKQEAIARAFGMKKNLSPTIVDATAGLGRDSFILAALGAEMILLERSPIISALLQDGIARGLQHPSIAHIVKRLTLIQTDAIDWLKITKNIDYIYLDPMFPARKKSALVKKEMQIFQEIIDQDEQTDTLFLTALACAQKRVVVKRPRLAECLLHKPPSFSITGKTSRFDVYTMK